MACSIVIDVLSIIATTDASGEVVRVEVSGDATDCTQVDVTLIDNNQVAIGPVSATPNQNGRWTAVFNHSQTLDLKSLHCGDKIEVTAQCAKSADGEKCEDKGGLNLPCRPGGGGCPDVTVVVRPGVCNNAGTARSMTLEVTVGGGAQIEYRWVFGDGAPMSAVATGTGTFTDVHPYATGATAQTYFATLIIVAPAGCTANPDPVNVVVDPCGAVVCPDNPRIVADRRLPNGGRDPADLEAACVAPGDYTIGVSNVYPAGTTLFWSVGEAAAVSGPTVPVTIGAGQTVEIEVIATKDGCAPVSESITLSGCVECTNENDLALERRIPGGGREPVAVDQGCIPAGRYTVRLIEPEGNVQVAWFEDGVVVPGQTGRALRIDLTEGQTLTVSAIVTVPGCPALNPSITIEACECDEDLSLVVFDQDGDRVDPADCVAPGTYTVRARGSGLRDESTEITWSIDGSEVAGNGTERDVLLEAPVVFGCSQGAPSTSVSVTVEKPGCDPQSAAVSLVPCAEFVYNVCCQIFGSVILLVFGLAVVAAALTFCPQVLIFPPLVAIATAFALPILLGLLALLVVLVIIWLWICPPDWCRDILPKLWQGAIMAGITFIYFGSCPLCNVTPIGSLFLWGVGLLLLGALLLLIWILGCRPSQCETVWRLFELGLVNSAIAIIETILIYTSPGAACVALGATIFLWLVTLFLDVLGFLLPPICDFNPIAPRAFGAFRRPPVDPQPRRVRRKAAAFAVLEGAAPRAKVAHSARAAAPPLAVKKKYGRDCGCGRK